VRIIGGRWKRTRLPVADWPGLRPTPDRVRETLFNWLASLSGVGGGALTGWRCADLFAGTGALGLEAASRGAAQVLLCEQEGALVAPLRALRERLDLSMLRIERGDGVAILEREGAGCFDIVFIDPPFDQNALYPRALQAAARALRRGGFAYLEAPRAWDQDELAALGFAPLRYLKAGAVHAHLLRVADRG
jgi:16S rRNA (guanine(966)-N(2))-methyltransferase RsmD